MSDYLSNGGIEVQRRTLELPYTDGAGALAEQLGYRRGMLMVGGVDCPGRYARAEIGFADPPLAITGRGRTLNVAALNARGAVLLPAIEACLSGEADIVSLHRTTGTVDVRVGEPSTRFAEEARSRQPSMFTMLRALRCLFAGPDPHLGLYGAFGYDLVFQFEPMALRMARDADQRDLVLYVPDSITVVDHARRAAHRHDYDFTVGGVGTAGLPRTTPDAAYDPVAPAGVLPGSDHPPGAYAATVRRAQAAFARGDLFEAVPGQTFRAPCPATPVEVFRRLSALNPAPYGALINLGDGEFLVAASPEMFVRVQGRRIETCPISGTIRRGADPVEDAAQIRTLLNSEKDEAELTMCTDVDRNDKSRVCEPGSVRILARRQIELYSRLIHTVDHVEGTLAGGYDALDGFLTHAWAVTVTGAPKPWAIRFIEENERTPRRWYGGAFGRIGFDGDLDTGLTLRTVRMQGGMAEVRAGATLLHDSVPEGEDEECRLKASAMLASLHAPAPMATPARARQENGPRVLLVDHEDSFVHTLAGYVRSLGATVVTQRPALAREHLVGGAVDLVMLSPGPGRPADFDMDATLRLALKRELPVFGVCLGLQGIVEHFGGTLDRLAAPMHGKPSTVRVTGGRLLAALPERFTVGRYHSLHACRTTLPRCLEVVAEADDGTIMAIEHRELPMAAVQFHPESLMTRADRIGLPLLAAALRMRAAVQA